MSWRASLLAVAIAAAVSPTFTLAQNQDNGGGGNGGGGGGRQRWDPQQMMQRRMDQIKEQLGASDDEWKVIEPKLTKIMDAQRQAFAGMGGMRGMGGPGGPGGGRDRGGDQGQQAPTTKLGQAAAELRKATQSDSSSPEDIDKKLAAYRAAKADTQKALDDARKDLKDVLTPKQEAVLVLNNMLE